MKYANVMKIMSALTEIGSDGWDFKKTVIKNLILSIVNVDVIIFPRGFVRKMKYGIKMVSLFIYIKMFVVFIVL